MGPLYDTKPAIVIDHQNRVTVLCALHPSSMWTTPAASPAAVLAGCTAIGPQPLQLYQLGTPSTCGMRLVMLLRSAPPTAAPCHPLSLAHRSISFLRTHTQTRTHTHSLTLALVGTLAAHWQAAAILAPPTERPFRCRELVQASLQAAFEKARHELRAFRGQPLPGAVGPGVVVVTGSLHAVAEVHKVPELQQLLLG